MKYSSLFAAILVSMMAGISVVHAQVLLLDPTTTATGTTTYASLLTPFSTAGTDLWNRGGTNNWGTLKYSNNTTATGVTVLLDALDNRTGGGAQYEFGNPQLTGTSTTGAGTLFGSQPMSDAVHYSTVPTNVGYGGMGMRVNGLAAGTYTVNIVAAYVGTTQSARPDAPSSSNIARFNTYAFTAPSASTLQAGTYDIFGATATLLENNNNSTWTEGVNYASFTVTVTGTNSSLYIVSENALFGTENRGWLNAVQIITVPEPATAALLAGTLGLFGMARRRRR